MQQNHLPQKVPFSSILDKYDNFFFDCDGVLWNGVHYLVDAFKALQKLKELGKNVFFVTNMSKTSRKDAFEKIKAGGFIPEIDQVFTSSYLAARYLSLNHPEVKKVYMIGLEGVREELEFQGLKVVGGESDNGKEMNAAIFDQIPIEEDIQAVVAALDYEINFYKLSYASVLLQRGVVFIATNPDSNVKMKNYKMPGGGCVVKFLEFSSAREAYVVGKPNPVVIEIATKTFGLDKSRSLMIGDRLDTDILVGKNANIDTFAVLTGVTTEEELLKEANKENGIRPTYYWDRVEI